MSDQAAGNDDERLNSAVAVTVAVLAAFMALGKVKDDNIVQAMQQAQADRIDHWGFYQARNLRQEIAEAAVAQLETAGKGDTPAAERYRKLAADMETKKQALRVQAEDAEKRYAELGKRDDLFDLSDGLLGVALAMLAVTALVQRWALYLVSMVPASLGFVYGMAGLMGWDWRPEFLVKLLT